MQLIFDYTATDGLLVKNSMYIVRIRSIQVEQHIHTATCTEAAQPEERLTIVTVQGRFHMGIKAILYIQSMFECSNSKMLGPRRSNVALVQGRHDQAGGGSQS